MGRLTNKLRLYVRFNTIPVISGRWKRDNERLVQWNLINGYTDLRLNQVSTVCTAMI